MGFSHFILGGFDCNWLYMKFFLQTQKILSFCSNTQSTLGLFMQKLAAPIAQKGALLRSNDEVS
jgi:hypothetical protein